MQFIKMKDKNKPGGLKLPGLFGNIELKELWNMENQALLLSGEGELSSGNVRRVVGKNVNKLRYRMCHKM